MAKKDRLSQRSLRYIIRNKDKKPAKIIAKELEISTSWVYKIWQYRYQNRQDATTQKDWKTKR